MWHEHAVFAYRRASRVAMTGADEADPGLLQRMDPSDRARSIPVSQTPMPSRRLQCTPARFPIPSPSPGSSPSTHKFLCLREYGTCSQPVCPEGVRQYLLEARNPDNEVLETRISQVEGGTASVTAASGTAAVFNPSHELAVRILPRCSHSGQLVPNLLQGGVRPLQARASFPVRSFTTSAAMMKPATGGTKGTVPGMLRLAVHTRSFFGQTQLVRQGLSASTTLIGTSRE